MRYYFCFADLAKAAMNLLQEVQTDSGFWADIQMLLLIEVDNGGIDP